MAIVMHCKVARCEQRTRKRYVSGFGDNVKNEDVDDGWFVVFHEIPHSSFSFGNTKPPFSVGDKVKLTFEKE